MSGRYGLVHAEAYKRLGKRHSAKVVYSCLAMRCDASGECYPEVKTIAEDADMSERYAEEMLAVLVKAGLINREKRTTEGGCITSSLTTLPLLARGVNQSAPGGEPECALGVSHSSGEHSHKNIPTEQECAQGDLFKLKGQKPKASKADPPDAAFERFWKAYPRRVAKAKAKTAFSKAARSTDPETIIRAAEVFAKSPAAREQKYTPHPATWLNGARYDDNPKEWENTNAKDATKYRPTDVERRPTEKIEV